MDEREHEFWGQLVTQLGIPEDLREHIETRATREGMSPWDSILAVLRRDAQQAPGSRVLTLSDHAGQEGAG